MLLMMFIIRIFRNFVCKLTHDSSQVVRCNRWWRHCRWRCTVSAEQWRQDRVGRRSVCVTTVVSGQSAWPSAGHHNRRRWFQWPLITLLLLNKSSSCYVAVTLNCEGFTRHKTGYYRSTRMNGANQNKLETKAMPTSRHCYTGRTC